MSCKSHPLRSLSTPFRCLPDYLIIGAQKCGTTTLQALLRQHPDVIAAPPYEINYFSREYARGGNWYRGFFPLSYRKSLRRLRGSAGACGDSSPNYLFWPHAPARVREMLPEVRLIVLLRDPVERTYSSYHHMVRKGVETLSFEEAIETEAERVQAEREKVLKDPTYDSPVYRRHSYLGRSRYAEQLERWLAVFPREQILVVRSEDFSRGTAAEYEKVLDFIGVRRVSLPEYPRRHVGKYAPMAPETRKRLANYFAPYNQRLYQLLGRDFNW